MRSLSLCFVVIAVFSMPETVQAASSWDGRWKGYWRQRQPVIVTIQNGIVTDYFTTEKHYAISGTHLTGESLSFDTRSNHIVLTRTGENIADGIRIGTFNGRHHVGGLASGHGAGSAGGLFTRV
jgi:hypothetical protein